VHLAPKADYWMETPRQWIRVHITQRFTFYYPYDSPANGPEPDSLSELRITQQVFGDRSRETKHHNWTNPRFSKAKRRARWTGRSIFHKRGAPPPSQSTACDASSLPIAPGEPAGMRASLASMRTQLAKAQRQDPDLAQIIEHLKGRKAGSFLAGPRSTDSRKTKVRALQFRLASDGVLVARHDAESLAEDLPVVPMSPTLPRWQTPHASSAGTMCCLARCRTRWLASTGPLKKCLQSCLGLSRGIHQRTFSEIASDGARGASSVPRFTRGLTTSPLFTPSAASAHFTGCSSTLSISSPRAPMVNAMS